MAQQRTVTTILGRRVTFDLGSPWPRRRARARAVAIRLAKRATALGLAAGCAARFGVLVFVPLTLVALLGRQLLTEVRIRRLLEDVERAGPRTQRATRRLCTQLGVPLPRLMTGPGLDQVVAAAGEYVGGTFIAVSYRVETCLTDDELTAVIAHELAHVRHHHSLLKRAVLGAAAVGQTVALGIAFHASLGIARPNWLGAGVAAVLIPTAVQVMRAALLRAAEIRADHDAVEMTQNGRDFAIALYEMERPWSTPSPELDAMLSPERIRRRGQEADGAGSAAQVSAILEHWRPSFIQRVHAVYQDHPLLQARMTTALAATAVAPGGAPLGVG